jgi:hypothetical protein
MIEKHKNADAKGSAALARPSGSLRHLLVAITLVLGSAGLGFSIVPPLELGIRTSAGRLSVTVHGAPDTPVLLLKYARPDLPLEDGEVVDAFLLQSAEHAYGESEFDPRRGSAFYRGIEAPAPGNVSAQVVPSIVGSAMEVTWDPPPLPADYYVLERSQGADPAFEELESMIDPWETSYLDEDTCPGAANRYRLRAVYSVTSEVRSRPSGIASATAPIAAPSHLSITLQAGPTLLLKWTPPPMEVDEFIVERSINHGSFQALLFGAFGDETSYLDDDEAVAAGAQFCYRLRSVACNASSTNSAEACYTLPLNPPTNVVATWLADCTIRVRWTSPAVPVEEFIVERSVNGGPFVELPEMLFGDETDLIDDDVAVGFSFCYRVASRTQYATSSWTGAVCVNHPLPTPSGLTAVALDETTISLSWAPIDDCIEGYVVYRSVCGGPWEEIDDLDPDSPATEDYDLNEGSIATYRVQAYTTLDSMTLFSADSNLATATTLPYAPSDLTLDNGTLGKVILDWWDDSDNEAGYIIFRAVGTAGLALYDVVGPDVETYPDSSVSVGAVIHYEVRAYAICGASHVWSAPSNPANILATPVLRSPPNDPDYSSRLACPITLDWDRVVGAAKYRVAIWYIHNDGTGQVEQVLSTEVTGTSLKPSCGSTGVLKPGRRHKWRVRALSADGTVLDSSASRERYFATQ